MYVATNSLVPPPQKARIPSSTGRATPLIRAAAGEAGNTAAAATSAGSPRPGPGADALRIRSPLSLGDRSVASAGHRVGPGQIALQRIPLEPQLGATFRVSPTSPNFAAV